MKKLTMVKTGELVIVQREKNSLNGNPRYLAMVDGVAFYTRPDSMHAYGLTNYKNKQVTVTLSMYRNKLSLDDIKSI